MRELRDRTVREIERVLRAAMPSGWDFVLAVSAESGADARLELIAPDNKRSELRVVFRTRVSARVVDGLQSVMRVGGGDGALLVAPFLSQGAQEYLRQQGGNYLDLTGAMRIELKDPALWVVAPGAAKNPNAASNQGRATFGSPQGCRVARGLVELSPPFTIQEFAQKVEVSPSRVSKIIAPRLKSGALKRVSRGPITEVAWKRLLLDWSRDYEFAGDGGNRNFYFAGGIEGFKNELRAEAERYAITGTEACSEIAPFSPSWTMMLYVDDVDRFARRYALRPADGLSTVMLLEASDESVFRGSWTQEGLRYVSISRLVVDLLAGPGRMSSEGENLMRWMGVNEGTWRSRMSLGSSEAADGGSLSGKGGEGVTSE